MTKSGPAAVAARRSMIYDDHESSLEIASQQRASIRKFRGNQCPVLAWDGLRKDSDLWFEDGDCLIHLYAYGASQRGPSFRLPFSVVESLASGYLLDECIYVHHDDDSPVPVQYDVYVPVATGLQRSDAYSYHLNTRNCFAFAAGLPVVGQRLGEALCQLWDRLQQWDCRLVSTVRLIKYCESLGYMDLSANAGHALAMLTVAEHIRHTPLYIDAFVHCVGMQDRLDFNPEYLGVSNKSRVLIERAALEMDLHISQVLESMTTFLENEMSAEYLGLTKSARDHLDRFRSFLINFYVEKLGYYPPPANRPWKKRLWSSMYLSFRNLYDYLVDEKSSAKVIYHDNANENDCIVKNIQNFDKRHGFEPLPHPLPLLPSDVQPKPKMSTSDLTISLRQMRLSRPSQSSLSKISVARKSLDEATNRKNPEVLACSLVKEYQRFERQKLEEKLTPAEARNVRWLLIYNVLQMLTSVVRAPTEVRDAHSPPYPVCVLTTDCPPWNEDDTSLASKHDSFIAPLSIPIKTPRFRKSPLATPESDVDVGQDYFATRESPAQAPPIPTRRTVPIVPILRTSSNRSGDSASNDSPTQSVAGSSKRQSRVSFGAVPLIHPALRNRDQDWENHSTGVNSSVDSEEWMSNRRSVGMSRSSSQNSDAPSSVSSLFPASTRSSVDECDSPITDPSSASDDADSCRSRSRSSVIRSFADQHLPSKTTDSQNVNVKCYQPTGFVDGHTRLVGLTSPSRDSVNSLSSSVYSDNDRQAADIAEDRMRGRQKLAAIVVNEDYQATPPRDLFSSSV